MISLIILTYPRKIKMWLVMTTNTIINHLQFFCRIDSHARHMFHTSAHSCHVFVLVLLKPSTLTNPIIRYL